MNESTELSQLLNNIRPKLNKGIYVFCQVKDASGIPREDVVCEIKEEEGTTLILRQALADAFELEYDFLASWITLTVQSSLDAVGLTATFSKALADHDISCNVIAGYHHDHVFVNYEMQSRAMEILNNLKT